MDTSAIDLLSLIGRDTKLKKVATTGGGEYHGACPFCGGKDRFRVQPSQKGGGRFACRQCGASGDAIDYQRRRDNLDFSSACHTLGLHPSAPTSYRVIRPTWDRRRMEHRHDPETVTPSDVRADAPALTDAAYQDAALTFVCEAAGTLHTPQAARPRDWLHRRGLPDDILKAHAIGYNPNDHYATWGNTPVWLPRGIVIPWYIGAAIWRVNFRRPQGEPKYIGAKGWANGLYLADTLEPDTTAVLVEGEFDALLLRALFPDMLDCGMRPVATGSTALARALRWLTMLSLTDRVLVAFDSDDDGEKAAQWWLKALDNSQRLKPTAHDVTDMYKAGADLSDWLVSAAPELPKVRVA